MDSLFLRGLWEVHTVEAVCTRICTSPKITDGLLYPSFLGRAVLLPVAQGREQERPQAHKGLSLTSRYSNHSAPIRQSRPRSLVRKLATFCRPLFDMKPVAASSRMLASTKGTPVLPSAETRDGAGI